MEYKTLKFELKDLDEEEGVFTGYASTFTRTPDSYGDVVDKSAFKKTIKENRNRIKILFNHNINEVIGIPQELTEDDKGLFVKGKLVLGVQRARETYELMKAGAINEMSIGYDTVTEKFEGDGVNKVRHLKEVKLYDVSPVTFAANPDAGITGVKAELTRLFKGLNEEKVREAIKALQALLEDNQKQEPETSTPVDDNQEAAEMEGKLAKIEAELNGFSVKDAEARIDRILQQITEVKTNA